MALGKANRQMTVVDDREDREDQADDQGRAGPAARCQNMIRLARGRL